MDDDMQAEGRMTADFIYNDQGACVARIVNDEVFRDSDQRKIAIVRDGNLYSLDGKLLGHLEATGSVRTEEGSTPGAFTQLLSKS